MKISVIYHSMTGNTKKQANLVVEGASKVAGVEVKSMAVEDLDKVWVDESVAIIIGSPTYYGTCSWQIKRFLDMPKVKLSGKLAGFFASQNWPGGGGADFVEITMIAAALVHGMLIYSGGTASGHPYLHFGAVSHKAPTSDLDQERAVKLGENIASKAMELFGDN